jgi:hypothetical protein
MNLSATMDGEVVNIVQLNVDGIACYVSYVTTDASLKVKQKTLDIHSDSTIIATGVTIN